MNFIHTFSLLQYISYAQKTALNKKYAGTIEIATKDTEIIHALGKKGIRLEISPTTKERQYKKAPFKLTLIAHPYEIINNGKIFGFLETPEDYMLAIDILQK